KYLPFSDFTAAGSPEPSAKAIPPAASITAAAVSRQIIRKSLSSAGDVTSSGAREGTPRAGMRLFSLLRQCEHGERSTECGVIAQRCIATDCAETCGRVGQAGCEADTCPTADAGQN